MAELKGHATPQPQVKIELEYLMNLGNFENAKVVVSIKDYVRPGEHIDDTFDRVYAKVDEQLSKRALALREAAGDL